MFKHSLYPDSYFARIILPIPATHFENTTFLFGPIYMEDPVFLTESGMASEIKGNKIS